MRKKIIHNKVVAILFFLMIFGFKLNAESILSIKDNYAKKPLKGMDTTAAYFEVINSSPKIIRLQDITCEGVKRVSFHEMEIDPVNKLMKMKSLKSIKVMPGSARKFKPMGEHLMMMGLEDGFEEKSIVFCSLYANDNKIFWSFPLK